MLSVELNGFTVEHCTVDAAIGHALTLSDVPRDPEVRGFVRVEQQHHDASKEPCASGATLFLLRSGTLPHDSARTRQDSLILAFWGSRGTTDIRSHLFKRTAFSLTGFLSRQATEKPLLIHDTGNFLQQKKCWEVLARSD